MIADDLAFTPAVVLAERVRRREISPVELTELYLERIERLNPATNAYVTVAADQALDAARAAEKRVASGHGEHPPFLGVPISIKDLNDTQGIRTTHGCAAWHDRVPDHDDEVVARIRQAGFVILGKTVTPELGPVNVSEPPGYPPGRNPWNVDRSCGGSSGGAAAALASGLCPVSQGSDGGGSIRNPSAWCGVYGLKPSRGRVSDAPREQQFFSVQGPITRSVADAAALLDVLAGPSVGDAFWAPPPGRPYAAKLGVSPGPLRVALVTRPTGGEPVVPAYVRAAHDMAMLLEQLGNRVDEIDPPGADEDLLPAMALMFCAAYAAREPQLPPLETISPWMASMIDAGRTIRAADYLAAQTRLLDALRRIATTCSAWDVLVTPTVAFPPPLVGEFADIDFSRMPQLHALTPFTGLWNMTGQPAVSIPWALDDDGLPIGVQLVGPPAGEDVLLQLSTQVELSRPWAHWRPPIS
jgi:amidase